VTIWPRTVAWAKRVKIHPVMDDKQYIKGCPMQAMGVQVVN